MIENTTVLGQITGRNVYIVFMNNKNMRVISGVYSTKEKADQAIKEIYEFIMPSGACMITFAVIEEEVK